MAAIAKTPAVLSSEILLKSSGYAGWFILLEGDFDQRFWTSRLNKSHLRPINCVGKPNVLGTLSLLESGNKAENIVGLVDRDFDGIMSRLSELPRLIYTDENDLEVTLLCCTSGGLGPSIDRILSESVDVNKRLIFEAGLGCSVVDHLRKTASNYGSLRLVNEELQAGVAFDDLPVLHQDFFDHSTLCQKLEDLQAAFLSLVNQVGRVQLRADQLLEKLSTYRDRGLFSGWDLVQGHDLMHLLATAMNSSSLRNDGGHRQVSEQSLNRDLCLMIHREDLIQTCMFQSLIKQGELATLPVLL